MRENMQSVAKEYTKRNHWRKIWRRIAGGLACVVVFCTIYALMLPALTLESETICGLEEHTHTEECYRQITSEQVSVLNCKMEAHSHGEECYDAEGKLLCGQVNYVLHTHTEVCSVDGELVCQLPEVKEHSHGDGCWETRKAAPVLVCENAEEDHVHGDECYAVPLSCDIPVSEEHNHEDACYQTETVLVCTVPEIKAHSHSAECEGGCDMIEVAAHVHGEDCFETQEIPVDTETLTCQIPEEEHTHGPMCYGTWVLECQLEEHTHTENCEPKQELTEEELAQVDAVIQQIDTLETTEQVEAKLAEYETAEDWEGYETYREEAAQKIQAVRDSYNVLSDAQKQKVTNAAKLTQLDWLVPMATLEEEENANKGEIKDWLDGDHAYIKSLKVISHTTGTSPWDGDNEAGNDQNAENDVLRTFDVMTYTLEFETKLRDAKAQEDVGGYNAGRVYFEFILPASRSEAQFETDSMGFLQTAENIHKQIVYDVNINGVPCQVLRGSYTLSAAKGNAAIGASTSQVNVTIRALRMQNKDTIQPTFTMWLQHNDVGATYQVDDRLPANIVTGLNKTCEKTDTNENGDTVEHGCEAATCVGEKVIISARPMFNVTVVGIHSMNSAVDTYDFDSGNAGAINHGLGSVTGRLNGMGLRLEIRGKKGHGLKGAEIPTTGTITFDVTLSTEFDPIGEESYRGRKAEDDYLAQFWTGGGNYHDWVAAKSEVPEIRDSANQTGRVVNTGSDRIAYLPANWALPDPYDYRSCYDGGVWNYKKVDANKLRVTVSEFEINTAHFPSTFVSGSKGDGAYGYYDWETVKNYWDIEQAVFSGGELWVLQPYYAIYGDIGKYICDKRDISGAEYSDGQFYTKVEVSNLSVTADGQTVDPQHITLSDLADDNSKEWGKYLKQEGDLDGRILYVKYGTSTYNDTLTDGGFEQDWDWAATGTGVTIESMVIQDDAEGEFLGVACDDLIKFDDEFFEPNGNYRLSIESNKPIQTKVYWAVWAGDTTHPLGSGWPSDQHMMEATMDDMVYYSNLADIPQGYAVVGLLREIRGVFGSSGMNHYTIYVDGTVKGQGGNVYMVTRNSCAWTKKDVDAKIRAYYDYGDEREITDGEYNTYLQAEDCGFPSRKNNDINLFKPDARTTFNSDSGYPQPSWWHDYFHTSTNADGTHVSAFGDITKATYENGVFRTGNGVLNYQDSCLVVPYETRISKTTAQIESSTGNAKQVYDMSQNQRTVVYQLNPSIAWAAGEGSSSGSSLTTTVYIEDVLPAGVTYEKAAYFGGSYDPTADPLSEGAFTGKQFNTTPDYQMTFAENRDGTTTLRWWFDVNLDNNLDSNATFWTPPIYYVCSIGNPGAENDVKNEQELVNTVKIWAVGPDDTSDADDDDDRFFRTKYGNLDTYSILIQKTSAVSLAKISDFLVVDKGEPFGFTMTVGNNSGEEKKNTVIVESLPIDGLNRTDFTGRLVVSEFTAELVNAGTAKLADKLTFYYTTSEEYAGKLSSDILAMAEKDGTTIIDWLAPQVEDEIWKSLTFDTSADNKLPSVTEQEGWNTYESGVDKKYKQITAILAVGDLPAGATLKMHITIQLPEGEAKDYMVNYLSQDESLTSYARAQMVNRTLEGLTWLDSDRDGVQDSSEEKISGVKVSLLKLNEGLKSVDNYVPVCYPGTQTPIQIQTGQTISFLAEAGTTPTSYNEGCYQFTDLPAGTYAVEFTDIDPDKDPIIANLVASPVDNVTDDTKDSDGVPTYSSDKKRLEKTRIEGIVMPEAHKLTYGEHVSRYHDSGFYYRDVELPSTGGMGTILFYVIGGPLTLAAGAVLCRKKRKEKGSSES